MATDEGPLYLLENSNTGVLRSAQDDSIGAFSRSVLRRRLRILPDERPVGIDDQPGGGAQGAKAGGG